MFKNLGIIGFNFISKVLGLKARFPFCCTIIKSTKIEKFGLSVFLLFLKRPKVHEIVLISLIFDGKAQVPFDCTAIKRAGID